MANKFKVMASNAKEPDGKCIPKSMHKSVESACGKKKAVKASDSESKFRIDIFKKDNPDALVKREFKMFKSEDEAKKYGESIANGNTVNVMKVKASCAKRSVKSSKVLTVPKSKRKPVKAAIAGDLTNKDKRSIKTLIDKFFTNDGKTYKSGDWRISAGGYDLVAELYEQDIPVCGIIYYAGVYTVESYGYDADDTSKYVADILSDVVSVGVISNEVELKLSTVESSVSTKKQFGVKASKSAKKRVAAAKGYWADDINAENYRKILKALDDYLIANYDGKTIGDVEIGVSGLRNIKDGNGSKIEVEFYSPDYEKDTKLEIISAPDLRSKFLCRVSVDPFKFDEELEIPQSGSKQIVVDKINEIANRLSGSAVESSCKTKKTVKASAAAKKRKAIKASGIADDIYRAKSIKCTQGDFTDDFSEDEFPFRVTSYYDHSQRGIADGASFDDMDEAVAYAHEKLSEGPVRIEHYDVGAVDINPDEYWENFDGEFWCTPELAEWRDEVWKSMGIGASKSIKCNDGIAPDDYDSVEDLAPEAYALSGGEDDDMLEYVDDYIATEGCPATVNFVTYNTPNDWSVDVSKYGEDVVSDFIWYLEEVASELSDKFYDYPSYEDDTTRNAFKGTKYEEGGKYATFYGDNALAANDYEFQFYPAQNQWSAPQIEFDTDELKLIGFTDDEIDKLMQIYEDYKTAWIGNCKYINAHIGEFLADLESNVNASTNIKADLSLNLNAKPSYTDWILRGYKFDGEDVTTLRIDFQDDVREAVADMFSDPDIETVDFYKIATDQDTTGVFEDEEYFNTITREDFESNVDITSAIAVGDDSRMDFSNPIYELDDYIKAIADGVVNQIQGITYDISKETIAFFDEDSNVVFVQPIGGIIPEPDDLETDIDELSAAIQSEMDNAYARDNWEQDEDDSDYATRAVELSTDVKAADETVDIDDLEPIAGDTSAEDRIFDVIMDKLRTSELAEFGEVDILGGDADIKVYPDGADIDYTIAFVADPITINFEDRFMKYEKYPDDNMLNHTPHINGLTTEIIVHNGTIGAVNYVDLDDYDLSNYDIPAYEKYVERLARPVVEEIYNFVDQAVYDGNITSSTTVTADVDDEPNDWGFGFDSNGDPIDESTVEELGRIAQEVLDKSEIHNIDEYADLHNFNYYASIPYIQESFNITFTYVADIYELSDRGLINDYGIFTTVAPYNIHFNVRCNNGEVEYAECTDVDVNNGYVKDVELKNFNLDALIQFATDLVNPVAADIYNATTNI